MSVNTKMKAIADEIRTLSGTTEAMGLDAMANNVGVANDEVVIQAELLAQIIAALEAKFGGSSGDSAELPAVGTSAESCTWAQIKAISEAGKADEYFNLGDIKTITLTDGTAVEMEIVAFDADAKADGSTVGITWISKGTVATHAMNSSMSNADGWAASEMRSWLQGDFYITLPDEVKDVIMSVNKTYYDYTTKSTLIIEDNVWVPSYREVYGNSANNDSYETSGADYIAFFTDDNSRTKNDYEGSVAGWWLRSASSNNNGFRNVTPDGACGDYLANLTLGVVLGFCV